MIDPVILTLSGTAIGGVIGIAGLLMKSKSDAKHAKAQQRMGFSVVADAVHEQHADIGAWLGR